MTQRTLMRSALHSLLIASLLLGILPPTLYAQDSIYLPLISGGSAPQGVEPETSPPVVLNTLLRTRVTVRTTAQWQTLARLDVLVLEQSDNSALVLVDDQQLTDLARLRFNPTETNTVETLAAADRTLAASIQPLLQQLRAAHSVTAADETTAATARASLLNAARTLTADQRSALMHAANADGDGDGLDDAWERFVAFTAPWLAIERVDGAEAAMAAWRRLVAGELDPTRGLQLSLGPGSERRSPARGTTGV